MTPAETSVYNKHDPKIKGKKGKKISLYDCLVSYLCLVMCLCTVKSKLKSPQAAGQTLKLT